MLHVSPSHSIFSVFHILSVLMWYSGTVGISFFPPWRPMFTRLLIASCHLILKSCFPYLRFEISALFRNTEFLLLWSFHNVIQGGLWKTFEKSSPVSHVFLPALIALPCWDKCKKFVIFQCLPFNYQFQATTSNITTPSHHLPTSDIKCVTW